MARLPRTTRKVLIALYGAMLAGSVLLIGWMHRSEQEALRGETLSRLGGITGTLAAQLDHGHVIQLLERYDSHGMILINTQDARYYVLHEALRRPHEQNSLEEPLRVLVYDTRKEELQTVVTSADVPAFREPYTGPVARRITDNLTGSAPKAERALIGDRLLALDLLRTRNGHLVGAVVTELPLSALGPMAFDRLQRHIIAAVVLLALLGLLLFRSVGTWVRREEEQRDSWQQRHAGMADSIAYAGKIQRALVPRPELLERHFPAWFLLDKPKDMVSGDFHWFHDLGPEQCLVAVADCTGHGLPGAMMAAIGCSLLTDILAEDASRDPATILTLLNERLVRTLHQSGQRRGAGDGMDIALCRIDRARRELVFAGALRPLHWINNGQLTVINGDRMPVGGAHFDAQRRFTMHRIAYHAGDRIYLSSDGYIDQFGGPERGKFMTKRFNDLLLSGAQLPLSEQAGSLERAFQQWKGGEDQVDDICVLGIQVA